VWNSRLLSDARPRRRIRSRPHLSLNWQPCWNREARSDHAAELADGDRSCRRSFQRLLDVESIVGDDVSLIVDAWRGIADGGDHDGIGAIDELTVGQRLENGGRGGGGEKASTAIRRICFTGGEPFFGACGVADRRCPPV
jgi:hypothetical protein